MESRETRAQVEREARERLYPSLSNPSWLMLRKRREILRAWISRLPQNGLRVLDVGGRIQPYRPLLNRRIGSYVALDLEYTPLVDIIGRGEQMPFAGDWFDFVICTQMLEYAPEPSRVIAEIYRVLKPGGCLFLSVPMVYPRESEHDSWRFMPHGLRTLLCPFRQAEIVPEGTSITGFFRTICACLVLFARPALLRSLLRFTLVPVLNLTAVSVERMLPRFNDHFAANFSVWAQK
jgi:SAM-dependent methyltransferase